MVVDIACQESRVVDNSVDPLETQSFLPMSNEYIVDNICWQGGANQ